MTTIAPIAAFEDDVLGEEFNSISPNGLAVGQMVWVDDLASGFMLESGQSVVFELKDGELGRRVKACFRIESINVSYPSGLLWVRMGFLDVTVGDMLYKSYTTTAGIKISKGDSAVAHANNLKKHISKGTNRIWWKYEKVKKEAAE